MSHEYSRPPFRGTSGEREGGEEAEEREGDGAVPGDTVKTTWMLVRHSPDFGLHTDVNADEKALKIVVTVVVAAAADTTVGDGDGRADAADASDATTVDAPDSAAAAADTTADGLDAAAAAAASIAAAAAAETTGSAAIDTADDALTAPPPTRPPAPATVCTGRSMQGRSIVEAAPPADASRTHSLAHMLRGADAASVDQDSNPQLYMSATAPPSKPTQSDPSHMPVTRCRSKTIGPAAACHVAPPSTLYVAPPTRTLVKSAGIAAKTTCAKERQAEAPGSQTVALLVVKLT